MYLANKGNKQLRIDELSAKQYAADGFTVVDSMGKVIAHASTAEQQLVRTKKELAAAQMQIDELNAELNALRTANDEKEGGTNDSKTAKAQTPPKPAK